MAGHNKGGEARRRAYSRLEAFVCVRWRGRVAWVAVIGKLLGHTQAATTHRYAHLDADPVRRAAETIGATIAAAMDGRVADAPTQLRKSK